MNRLMKGMASCGLLLIASMLVHAQPAVPISKPANAVKDTSFTANWSAASGATGYLLDVSTDRNFGAFLPGFNGRPVIDTNSSVGGTTSGTIYYYRVRSTAGGQNSDYSSTTTVITFPGYPASIPTGIISGEIYYNRVDTIDGTVWKAAGDGSFDSLLIKKGSWPRLSRTGRYLAFHRGQVAYQWQRWFYIHDFKSGKDSLDFANGDNAVDFYFGLGDTTLYFDYSCGIYRQKLYVNASVGLIGTDCWNDNPVLSPGDTALAYHNAHLGLYVAKSNGTNIRLIPNTHPGDYFPNWSPDGQWITFSRGDGTVSYPLPPILNLYKIHPDGSGLMQLTFLQGSDSSRFRFNGAPTADGAYIVIPGKLGNTDGLFAIATDGSGVISQLTTSPGKHIEWVGSVSDPGIHTSVESSRPLATTFNLDQNYPNPFNPKTVVSGQWTVTSEVRLLVYDVLGRRVATLADGRYPAGKYSFTFDGTNFASGTYFYRLDAGGEVQVKKMMLLK